MAHNDNTTPHAAVEYESQVRKTIPYYDAFHLETLHLVAALLQPPARWLDTGCGTGTLAVKAGSLFPGTTFLLADPSEEMLRLADANCRAAGIAYEILGPYGTQQLPADYAGSLDVVTAIQAHHYLAPDERLRATRVCYDLLTPGGCYITFENIRPGSDAGLEIGKRNWQNFQLAAGRDPATVAQHLQRFGVNFFPITVEEHLRLLRAGGFRVVEMLWYSYLQAGFYACK